MSEQLTLTPTREAVTVDEVSRSVSQSTKRRYPWMGVGKDIVGATSAKDAIAQAELDWTVRLDPMYRYKQTTRGYVKVPDRFVSVREDTDDAVGAVGKAYVPWQNVDAFTFAEPLVDDGIAEWWAGGEQKGGAQVFVVVKFTADFRLVGDLETELFLMLRSSHDGSKSIQAVVTPIEAFCTNQTALIMSTAPMKWSVGHYRTATDKLEEAHKTLRNMGNYAQELRETSERLAAVELELEEAAALLSEVIPQRPRSRQLTEGILSTLQHSPTVRDEFRTTGWGLIEATTEFLDHRRPSRSAHARFNAISGGFNHEVRNEVARRLLAR